MIPDISECAGQRHSADEGTMEAMGMSESPPPEPPTYFANIATVHVNVDEISIEFRRVMVPHAELWKMQKASEVPPLKEEDVYEFAPQAKVVLTFTGAKNLQENLAKLLPTIERQRK